MKFRKVTSSKYIGDNGYSIYSTGSSYSIFKDSKIVEWGKECRTVKCAQDLVNSHDFTNATVSTLPISKSDLNFISEFYGVDIDGGKCAPVSYHYSIKASVVSDNRYKVSLTQGPSVVNSYTDIEALLKVLDRITCNDNFSSVIYRGLEFRPIVAAKGSSSRDFRNNLVRVKSSNVWAYGSEMKTNRIGDVYVQFKGKNGGPGDVYKYYDVPVTLWRKFISATSKGHFVWKYLRNNFMYSKLTGDKRGKLKNALN